MYWLWWSHREPLNPCEWPKLRMRCKHTVVGAYRMEGGGMSHQNVWLGLLYHAQLNRTKHNKQTWDQIQNISDFLCRNYPVSSLGKACFPCRSHDFILRGFPAEMQTELEDVLSAACRTLKHEGLPGETHSCSPKIPERF